ncbi:LysR family transcriptional regulator [Bacillus sp. FJAT-29937]|uniref:LysR family transcriptional regulator n=1 Tax=Bacillus sp. FJAT-29937 TaxID=1720553 RepID=UPI0008379B34|nr:LysR family transcriptional regulator [Bacillus sp. FJAT-29937]
MNIDQLTFIIQIAKTGSVSAAANALNISQPGISKSVTKLEEELGVMIFNRTNKGLVPTSVGEELIEKSEEIMLLIQELKEISEKYNTSTNRKLRLATAPTIVPYLSNSIFSLIRENPSMQIGIVEKESEEILNDINKKAIDIGFLIINKEITENKNIDFKKIITVKFYVTVKRDSELSKKQFLTPKDVENHRIIMYNSGIKKEIQELTNEESKLNISVIQNMNLIKKAIDEGDYISINTDFAFYNNPNMLNWNITTIPLIVNGEQLETSIGCARLRKIEMTKVMKQFLKEIDKIESPSTFWTQNSL